MPTIQRLNADSSWCIEYGGTSAIIDPWLIGEDIAGFKWFSHQKHIYPPIAIADLPKADGILISQQYPDHCHLETIEAMDAKMPILASPHAYRKMKSYFRSGRRIESIKPNTWINWKQWRVMCFKRRGLLSPNFYAIIIALPNNQAIFYAPHGYALSDDEFNIIKDLSFDLVMTTHTRFVLPALLGGEINLGKAAAEKLAVQLNPRYLVNTHDEMKEKAGLVAAIAKVEPFDPTQYVSDEIFMSVPFDGLSHKF